MGEEQQAKITQRERQPAVVLRDCDETVINQLKDAHILSDCII